MIFALRPPTNPLCEWLRRPQVQAGIIDITWFCSKVVPGNIFGLPIYSIQLARGALAPELRKTISVALAIGWALTALVAGCIFAFPPEGMAMTHTTIAALSFSFVAMVLAGTLVYNRVHYGFYL